MTDDYAAVSGEKGAYIPCNEVAAVVAASGQDSVAVFGEGEGHVAATAASSADVTNATDTSSAYGRTTGMVPGPCSEDGDCTACEAPTYRPDTDDYVLSGRYEPGTLSVTKDTVAISATEISPVLGTFSLATPGDQTAGLEACYGVILTYVVDHFDRAVASPSLGTATNGATWQPSGSGTVTGSVDGDRGVYNLAPAGTTKAWELDPLLAENGLAALSWIEVLWLAQADGGTQWRIGCDPDPSVDSAYWRLGDLGDLNTFSFGGVAGPNLVIHKNPLVDGDFSLNPFWVAMRFVSDLGGGVVLYIKAWLADRDEPDAWDEDTLAYSIDIDISRINALWWDPKGGPGDIAYTDEILIRYPCD